MADCADCAQLQREVLLLLTTIAQAASLCAHCGINGDCGVINTIESTHFNRGANYYGEESAEKSIG